MVFNIIFLINSDIQQIFVYLFATHVSSLVKCYAPVFRPFSIELFVFFIIKL